MLVLFACLLSAAPGLLTWAPPDTTVVFGINLEQIKPTKTGQMLWAETDKNDAALRQFIDRTGVDPRRDIAEIVVMVSGNNPDAKALLAVRGAFDLAKIKAAKAPGVTIGEYHGISMVTGSREDATTKRNQPYAIALVSPVLVVVGDPESVRAAIDRQGKPGGLNSGLAAQAELLAKSNDIWVAGRVPPEVKAKMAASPMTAMFQSTRQFGGGLKFGANIRFGFELVNSTPADAKAISDMLRGFIAMAGATQKQEAQAALQNIDMHVEGSTVKIALSVPEDEFIKGAQAGFDSVSAHMNAMMGPAPTPTPVPTGVTIYSSPGDMGTVKIDQ
ncbi:MAG: hypothetical protein ABSG25_14095 [Bryobacteraceae bacterium]